MGLIPYVYFAWHRFFLMTDNEATRTTFARTMSTRQDATRLRPKIFQLANFGVGLKDLTSLPLPDVLSWVQRRLTYSQSQTDTAEHSLLVQEINIKYDTRI